MRKSVRLKSFELVARDIMEAELSLLHALSLSVGWPHRPHDWQLLLRSGQGFVAEDGIGRVFGTAMWFPHDEEFATIGMVITSPRSQTQGNGRWLMEQILERCEGRNLGLNATQAAYNLYDSLGFATEAIVHQCQGEVAPALPELPEPDGEPVPLSAADLDAIAELDEKAFGASRRALLGLIAPSASIHGIRRGGKLAGYSCCREFGRGWVVGPIVADNDTDAIHLAAVHLKKLKGKFVRIDTRETDGPFADFLAQCRLGVFDLVTTMSKGRPFLDLRPGKARVYGLAAHAWS